MSWIEDEGEVEGRAGFERVPEWGGAPV